MRDYDDIIVGQGLAGTSLAWQLRWLGRRVLVVDQESPNSASRVAAGLISPVAGQRNAVSWRFDELWTAAIAFYLQVESEIGQPIFHGQSMLRILRAGEVPALPYTGRQVTLTPPLEGEAIELSPAARLDIKVYLDASRSVFAEDAAYLRAGIDAQQDLEVTSEFVRLRKLGLRARQLIFCRGLGDDGNPWFPELAFEPAKGEILSLKIKGLDESRVVNGDVWLAPVGDDRFLSGSTYHREFQHAGPTDAGRQEILRKLAGFVDGPFAVEEHQAAVRPVVPGRLPVIGLSKLDARVGICNGLGSKGALRAPWVTEQFARWLVHGKPASQELVLRVESKPESPRKLTERAHRHVAATLRPGDIAIDATAGNGLDTLFLANAVGPAGRVFAFDIQEEAISRTRARLEAENVTHVWLVTHSHEQMRQSIPLEFHGKLSAVMFNLGYLPRGDKQITTTTETTRRAIEAGLLLLGTGGVLTVVAYTGHPGGLSEATQVYRLLGNLPVSQFDVELPTEPLIEGPPYLFVARKSAASHSEGGADEPNQID